jgi:hypothetical protein
MRTKLGALAARRLLLCVAAVAGLILTANVEAYGRESTNQVTELDQILRVRPEFPVPNEPNMLFYIERSVNSNTVVYAANLDPHGRINPKEPVNAYWRWYNVDGHKKPLIFIERMLAYGVKSITHDGPHGAVTFKVAAVPERRIVLDLDGHGRPEASMQIGGRWVKLVYIYLQVDDSGFLPKVPALDIFGIDKLTGKALREHIIPH